MQRKTIFLLTALVLILVFPGLVFGQGTLQDVEDFVGQEEVTTLHLLGARAAGMAIDQLSFAKGDENVLTMSNSGCAIINGQTTGQCLDGLSAVSGCTVGKGNLMVVQRSKEKPLWFFFFNKNTKESLYLQVNNSAIAKTIAEFNEAKDSDLFSIISQEKIGYEYLLENADQWNQKIANKVFGGNESSLAGIANVWAHPACSYDLLRAMQLHNHICPGLTSGYLITKYLDKNLPLKAGQSYAIIACPPWCKDDAFQVIYDATVGKGGLYVKGLTNEQKALLPKGAEGVAGLFIRWDSKSGTGDGLVLAFDWNKAGQLSGADRSGFTDKATHRWWSERMKMFMGLMNYLDKPETVISTLKTFQLSSSAELTTLQAAGVNPLIEVGLMAKPNTLTIKIGEQKLTCSPLAVVNGAPVVPLREVCEALGAKVNWNSNNGSIVATKGKTIATLKLGVKEALKNGKKIQLTDPVIIINKRTFVPLQFVNEALGAKASWNPAAYTVSIAK